MKRVLVPFAAALIATSAFSQTIYSVDFESNTVGSLIGQAGPGGRVWAGGTTTVENTGPTLGAQSAAFSQSLGAGASSSHAWLDLVNPTTNFTIGAGNYLFGSVNVNLNPQDPNSAAGLSLWANLGANLNAVLAISGDGRVWARNGVGTPAITNVATLSGLGSWATVTIRTEQTDPNTLTSVYFINGQQIAGVSHSRTIATGNAPSDFDLLSLNVGTATATVSTRFDDYSATVAPVPEPATLVGLGLGALFLRRKRK